MRRGSESCPEIRAAAPSPRSFPRGRDRESGGGAAAYPEPLPVPVRGGIRIGEDFASTPGDLARDSRAGSVTTEPISKKPKLSLGLSSELNEESSQHVRRENRIGYQELSAFTGIRNSSDSAPATLPKWPRRRQRTHFASNVTRNPTRIEDHFPSVPSTGFMFGPPNFGPPGISHRFARQFRPPRGRVALWPRKNSRVC